MVYYWPCHANLKLKPGQLTSIAMFAYGGLRLLIELNFRAPSFEWLSFISTGALLCLLMMIVSVVLNVRVSSLHAQSHLKQEQ